MTRVSFSATPGAPESAAGQPPSRRGRVLIPAIITLVVLLILLVLFTQFDTDLMWFRSIDKTSVYSTQIVMRLVLCVVFGLLMALAIGSSMWVAFKKRPMLRIRNAEQLSLERYRSSLEPIRKPLLFLVPAVIGVLAGISAGSAWRLWAMWRNQVPFGSTDQQFGRDIGFYVFTYPFLRFVLGFLFAMVLLSLLAAVIVHYVYGGIRLQPPAPRVSSAAQVQLSVLLGIFCLLKAASYWLDRYGLTLKSEDFLQGFTGLKYRDINALLPAKGILAAIAIICAILFFVNVFRRSWMVAATGLGLLVLSALVIGGIYPAIVQQFTVRPSEQIKEQQSIQHNIDATRQAYNLNGIKVKDYVASGTVDQKVLATQQGTLNDIRIVDPSVVSPTFAALQQNRSFYGFPDTLDVDRYKLTDGIQGAVVAVRELNLSALASDQRNWANLHVVYTHGYGFVAAADNKKESNGNPVFFEGGIPPTGPLKIDQPRVYFGQNSPSYSIVGAPEGAAPQELDYPDDNAPNKQQNNTYTGTGGVPVGSLFNQLLFGIKFQDPNIVLSDSVNSSSRILWDRDPAVIVSKAAPWLRLDSDPYPVVVDGRIKWIVDGYTTSNNYPYSSRVELDSATSDSTVSANGQARQLGGKRDDINYMRNTVKAVVDAYDGTVNLYEWDANDPILKTWEKTFPGVVQPRSEMPASILAHVKYPEDMFKVQRTVFSRYHVTDPAAFYGGQDFWEIPNDPTKKDQNALQPPYYLSLQMPDQKTPQFSLTTAFSPVGRQTLASFMSVVSDPGDPYGSFEVLQLPRNTTIPGPQQVQNNFESNPDIASELSLLRRGGSEVDLGNLLSLPIGGGMLYVEPVYVRAATGGYPLLQKIMVGFGENTAMRDTLPEALNAVGVKVSGGSGGGGATPISPSEPNAALLTQMQSALENISKLYAEGQAALKSGDFAKYGEIQKQIDAAINNAKAIQQKLVEAEKKK